MKRFRPNQAAVLLLIGLTVLPAEAWLVRREHQRSLSALAALEQKIQERDWLMRQVPAPNSRNEKAIAAAVEEAKGRLGQWHEATCRDWGANEPAPDKPVEGYFGLTHFGQRMRERAVRAQVATKPGEYFGFADFAHEGPPVGQLQTVHRQVLIMEYLLEELLEAGPQALQSVKRTSPLNSPEGIQSGGGADYFSLPPGISVGVPGLLETDGFRLEFTGTTAVLRQFLNTLAQSHRTVIVRTVEAETMALPPPARTPARVETGPLIRAESSKFVVTMEVPWRRAVGGTGP